MKNVQRMITISEEGWFELQARCHARGIADFRACAGGFVEDSLEGGFEPRTEEEYARYEAFKAATTLSPETRA